MYYPGAVSTPGKLDYHLMIITTNLHINGTVHKVSLNFVFIRVVDRSGIWIPKCTEREGR